MYTFSNLFKSKLSQCRKLVPASSVVFGESCGVAAVVVIIGGSRFRHLICLIFDSFRFSLYE